MLAGILGDKWLKEPPSRAIAARRPAAIVRFGYLIFSAKSPSCSVAAAVANFQWAPCALLKGAPFPMVPINYQRH